MTAAASRAASRAAAGATSATFSGSWVQQALVSVIAIKIAALLLIFDPIGVQAFDFPKSLASRAFAWVLAGLLVLAFIQFGLAVVPRTRLHLFVLAMAGASMVATGFAQNQYLAAFGEFERPLGLSFIGDMLVLYVAVAVSFRTSRDWALLAGTTMLAGILLLAYATVQLAGRDPIRWSGHDRPFSTLGNPDILGHFLSTAFGASVGAVAAPRIHASALARGVSAFVACVLVGAALAVATRGTLIGMAAALMALPVVYVRLRRLSRRDLTRIATAVLLVVVVASPVLIVSPLAERAREVIAGTTAQGRPLIWDSAVRAFLDRPLLGYGLDNFAVAYPQYRQPESAPILGPGAPQNSAHNWLLHAAATTGLVGVMGLIALIAAGTSWLWRALPVLPAVASSLLLGWVAYWAHGLVSVGSVGVDWFPWVALGAAASARAQRQPPEMRVRVPIVAAVLLIAAAVAAGLTPINAFLANRNSFSARSAASAGRGESAVAAARVAVAQDEGRADYWNRLGFGYELLRRWPDAESAYAEATRRAPHEVTYWVNLGRARMQQASSGGSVAGALEAARTAVDIDPNNPLAHHGLAVIATQLRHCDIGIEAAVTAIVLFQADPAYDEAAARAAACSSDSAHARRQLERALRIKESSVLRAALARVS